MATDVLLAVLVALLIAVYVAFFRDPEAPRTKKVRVVWILSGSSAPLLVMLGSGIPADTGWGVPAVLGAFLLLFVGVTWTQLIAFGHLCSKWLRALDMDGEVIAVQPGRNARPVPTGEVEKHSAPVT